jgi:hypothetical protein
MDGKILSHYKILNSLVRALIYAGLQENDKTFESNELTLDTLNVPEHDIQYRANH